MSETQKREYINTPVGEAVYPHVTKPDFKYNKGGVYTCTLRVDGQDPKIQEIIAKIDAAVEAEAKEAKATLKAIKNPKRRAEAKEKIDSPHVPYEEEYDDDGEPTGNYLIRFKAHYTGKDKEGNSYTRELSLFDTKRHQLTGKRRPSVYSGSELVVNFFIAPFWNPQVGLGVTLYMRAVLIKTLRSGSANPFGDMSFEDGYVADEGGNPFGEEDEDSDTSSSESEDGSDEEPEDF